MVMITTAEYIQIIAAGIYATALFYTIVTFRRSKKLDQLAISDRIFSELRELDRELAKIPSESQYDNARSQVYSRIFNTLDYLSFLVNRKVIDDRLLLEYMKPSVIKYYEVTFLKNASSVERDSNSYQQFKKNFISNSRRSKMSSIQCHSSLLVRNGPGGSWTHDLSNASYFLFDGRY
jgi:hypothetical protein